MKPLKICEYCLSLFACQNLIFDPSISLRTGTVFYRKSLKLTILKENLVISSAKSMILCIEKKEFSYPLFTLKTVFIGLFLSSILTFAQTEHSQFLLEQEIEKMDSLLFDAAFNQCDFETYKTIMKDGLEFYDDRTGFNNKIEVEYASFKDKCSKPFSVTRKRINHSVHKLGVFGAMQKGMHIFLVDEKVVQSAEFITVWEKTKQGWIVKRAISYDHKEL